MHPAASANIPGAVIGIKPCLRIDIPISIDV
jgi:hypothetical protein